MFYPVWFIDPSMPWLLRTWAWTRTPCTLNPPALSVLPCPSPSLTWATKPLQQGFRSFFFFFQISSPFVIYQPQIWKGILTQQTPQRTEKYRSLKASYPKKTKTNILFTYEQSRWRESVVPHEKLITWIIMLLTTLQFWKQEPELSSISCPES